MRAQHNGSDQAAAGRAEGARTARSPLPPGRAAGILALQRAAGNAAVTAAVEAGRHEHDANCGHGPAVQRSLVHQVLRGSGTPMETGLRSEMEGRFGGADFGGVRLHTDVVAQRSAAEIGASAYTSGSHVVWNGRDKHTLAHELTHVLQQRRGPVAGTDTGGGLSVSDPGDRFERAAEANAARVMSGPAPVQRAVEAEPGAPARSGAETSPAAPVTGDGAAVQRRVETGARVGFEFQQLYSDAYVRSSDESVSDSEAEVQPIRAPLYGRTWKLEQDGSNLEFVTEPFADLARLTATVKEISRVAADLLRYRDEQEFEIGDMYVTMEKKDDTAQPQVNPDIPLDALPGVFQQADSDEQHAEDYYSVGGPYWDARRTGNEVAAVASIGRAIEALPADRLAESLRMPEPTAAALGSAKGLLQAIASAVLHTADFHTKLDKDQPVLVKTDLGALWKSLVADGVVGARTTVRDVVDLLIGLDETPADADDDMRRIVTEVLAGRDPVWPSGMQPRDIPATAREDGGADAPAHRKQILVELRRVPILHHNQWTGFAEQAFRHFVADEENRFHRDL
ncbi:eCIS core domain-containing protein [Streptomyces echinatus]|uniref:eCIS core domain-containing protein n=1 Tax=Streptomyces echinatus TaxID=67293 RepID=A0A7W9PX02_9ACTN|nr:DUF4157 domain-containing protein [Streptomyces echinatus]MBB5929480.1 hypothetical protein [Streptomyces echinatus]